MTVRTVYLEGVTYRISVVVRKTKLCAAGDVGYGYHIQPRTLAQCHVEHPKNGFSGISNGSGNHYGRAGSIIKHLYRSNACRAERLIAFKDVYKRQV